MEMASEGVFHLLGFLLSHQSVVDEDTRELVAHRFVDKKGCDSRVYASGQSAHHPFVAYLFAHSGRQVLALQRHKNPAMSSFLDEHDAGTTTESVSAAVQFLRELASEESHFDRLPELRTVPSRIDLAEQYGIVLQKSLTGFHDLGD